MQTLSQWLELSAPEPEPCIDNMIKLIYSPGHFNHITVPAAFKCNCIWGQGTPLILCFGNSSVSGLRKLQGKRRRPRAPWTTSGACSNGWESPLWGSQVAIENPWYLRNCVFYGKIILDFHCPVRLPEGIIKWFLFHHLPILCPIARAVVFFRPWLVWAKNCAAAQEVTFLDRMGSFTA